MKKRFLLAALTGMLLAAVAFGFAACDKDDLGGLGNLGGGGNKTINLSQPQNVLYDGKTISWDPVENAVKYTVSISTGTTQGQEYSVALPHYGYISNGETFNVSVRARGNGDNIVDSEATVTTFNYLGAVEWLAPSDDGTLKWSLLPDATSYRVLIDGVESSVAAPEVSGLAPGTHSVQVKPVLDSDPTYYASWSEAKIVTILGQVQGDSISYADGKITWRGVNGAACYEVTVNGTVVASDCTSTSLTYDAQSADLAISVRAIGDHERSFDGTMSTEKQFFYLATVSTIYVEDGIVTWDAVDHADAYEVRINDSTTVVVNEPKYDKLSEGIATELRIRPVSRAATYFSNWSAPHNVQILQRPVLQWYDEASNDGERVNNVYWDLVAGATGYSVRVTRPDGSIYTNSYGPSISTFDAETYAAVGTYKIEAKSLAPKDDSVIHDSLYSAPITVVRLAAPTRVSSEDFIKSDPSDLAAGFTVNFKPVAGATGYELSSDGTQSVQTTTTNSFRVTNIFDEGATAETTITYSISSRGKSDSGKKVYTLGSVSSDALKFSVTVLAMPQNVDISGFDFMYGIVRGADGYSINVSGQKYTSYNTSYDLSTALKAGRYNVSVCSRGNGKEILPSAYTPNITVHRLEAPHNIGIDTTDNAEGRLVFDPVEFADSYNVNIQGIDRPIAYDEMENLNQYIKTEATSVSVVSVANHFDTLRTTYYMTSLSSETEMFMQLDAPTFGANPFESTSRGATQLVWNVPQNVKDSNVPLTYIVYNANGYSYEERPNGRTMDISNFEGGKNYGFAIRAIGCNANGKHYVSSELSDTITRYKLESPQVGREDGKYVWSGVTDAVGYAVFVEGEIQNYEEKDGRYSFTPNFGKVGFYRVEVVALGNSSTTLNSKAYAFDQETSQLATPDFEFAYSDQYYTPQGTITVTITDAPANARGYDYTIGGKHKSVAEATYTSDPITSSGTYYISVYALGGTFDEEGIYYLDSQTRGNNDRYRLTILASPNKSGIEVGQNGVVTWDVVPGALKYEVEIVIGSETIKITTNDNTARCQIENFLSYKGQTVRVSIRALGNGKDVISSDVVEKEFGVIS